MPLGATSFTLARKVSVLRAGCHTIRQKGHSKLLTVSQMISVGHKLLIHKRTSKVEACGVITRGLQ